MKAVFLNVLKFISPFYDENSRFLYIFLYCWVKVNIINLKKSCSTYLIISVHIHICIKKMPGVREYCFDFSWNLCTHFLKIIEWGPQPPFFATFLLLILGNKLLDPKNLEFDLSIGHAIVIFLFFLFYEQ